MKCPLFFSPRYKREEALAHGYDDCLKKHCAWWDDTSGRCAVLEHNRIMTAIGNTLGKIADNMPTEKQFRR